MQVGAFAGLGRGPKQSEIGRARVGKIPSYTDPSIFKSSLERAQFRFGLEGLKCATGTDGALLPLRKIFRCQPTLEGSTP